MNNDQQQSLLLTGPSSDNLQISTDSFKQGTEQYKALKELEGQYTMQSLDQPLTSKLIEEAKNSSNFNHSQVQQNIPNILGFPNFLATLPQQPGQNQMNQQKELSSYTASSSSTFDPKKYKSDTLSSNSSPIPRELDVASLSKEVRIKK
eukprot:403353938